jgi:hypothetical protein
MLFRQLQSVLILGSLVVILVACSSAVSRSEERPTPMPTLPPSPTVSPTPEPQPTATFPPVTPTLDLANGEGKEGARLVLAFINAFNAGRLDEAADLLDDDAGASDCNWDTRTDIDIPRGGGNKDKVVEWLRQRLADHDQLIVSRILQGSDSPNAFGVHFVRRTSDTLRRLGFPDGLNNIGPAKVILTFDYKHILNFALGPGPQGDKSTCYPENHI